MTHDRIPVTDVGNDGMVSADPHSLEMFTSRYYRLAWSM